MIVEKIKKGSTGCGLGFGICVGFFASLIIVFGSTDGEPYPLLGFIVVWWLISLFGFCVSAPNAKAGTAFSFYLFAMAGTFLLNKGFIFSTWWVGLVIFIAVTELFFFLDKSKPKKKDKIFSFTIQRKLSALFDAFIFILAANNIKILWDEIFPSISFSDIAVWFSNIWQSFTTALPGILYWAGIVAGIIALTVLYLWLNSIRYKKRKTKHL